MANGINLAVDLAPIQTVVDAIRAVDVPLLDAEHLAIITDTQAIRTVDVPAITDAIAARIVRGEFKYVYDASTSATYNDVLNISGGSGKIMAMMNTSQAGVTQLIRFTFDSITMTEYTLVGNATEAIAYEAGVGAAFAFIGIVGQFLLNIDFKNSVQIEHKRTVGATEARLGIYYIED